MIHSKSIVLLATLLLPALSLGQQSAPAFQIRAVLHDPVNPVAELYLPDQTGRLVKLNLQPEGLAKPQPASLINGALLLFDNDKVDPRKPEAAAALAATIAIPQNVPRGILIVVPSPPGTKPAYRGVFVDDTPAAF